MAKTLAVLLTGILIASLTVPAFADSYTDKFPNCSALDGFVTNAGDSSGLAKDCLDSTNIHIYEFSHGDLSLSEITSYCEQFNSTPAFEQKCIDDYGTDSIVESQNNYLSIIVGLLIGGVIVMFFSLGCIPSSSKFYQPIVNVSILMIASGFIVFILRVAGFLVDPSNV